MGESRRSWLVPAGALILLVPLGFLLGQVSAGDSPAMEPAAPDVQQGVSGLAIDLSGPLTEEPSFSLGADHGMPSDGTEVVAALQSETAPQVTNTLLQTRTQAAREIRELTPSFEARLEGAHLWVSADGDRLLTSTVGIGTPRQLVLSQTAADRFGIRANPFFDPSRVAVVQDGRALADLGTGVIIGHPIGSALFGTTEVIDDQLLGQLRATAGWTLTSARRAEAARWARLLDYVPVFVQSDEAYATYMAAARANYQQLASS